MNDRKLTRKDLHNYQNTGVDHILDNPAAGLFLDMGLGKTVTTLTAIDELIYGRLEVLNVLVIAPKRVVDYVWEEEAHVWEHLRHLRIEKVRGTAKQRLKALKTPADIHLIGRDNVSWLCGLYGGSMIPFDMVVIDELSSFKNPKSQRFKALRMVRPSVKRIVGLTGTPSPNGLIDLWSQLYLLDMGRRLGKFITSYRENYFYAAKKNGNIVYKYGLVKGAEDMIYGAIGDICMSMSAEDYLELPEVKLNDIEIVFPPNLQDAYNEFEREKVLDMWEDLKEQRAEKVRKMEEDELQGLPYTLEAGYVSSTEVASMPIQIAAPNAAALTNKLLQFSNGAIYDEDRNVHEVHELKLDEAKEIVENANGSPVLIAYTYQHDRDRLLKALKKYKPRTLKSDKDVLDWNNGEVQVLLMHPASGGHGLNLQSGGHIIVWFGQTWSLELYMQFNARLNRQGQKERVIINRLISCNTEDQNVVKALARKNGDQAALMEAVKAKIEKYVKE